MFGRYSVHKVRVCVMMIYLCALAPERISLWPNPSKWQQEKSKNFSTIAFRSFRSWVHYAVLPHRKQSVFTDVFAALHTSSSDVLCAVEALKETQSALPVWARTHTHARAERPNILLTLKPTWINCCFGLISFHFFYLFHFVFSFVFLWPKFRNGSNAVNLHINYAHCALVSSRMPHKRSRWKTETNLSIYGMNCQRSAREFWF